MNRYIDADELIRSTINNPLHVPYITKTDIDAAPTADVVPVRHGHWIVEWETDDTRMLRCSECKMVFNVGKGRDGNWCPECGARMDSE